MARGSFLVSRQAATVMTEQAIIVRRDRHQDTEILGVADAAQGVAALVALAHFINMGRRHDHAVARCPELQETHFLAQESLLTFRFHALAAGASESYLELGLLVRIRASLVQRQALETVRLAVRNVVLRLGVDELVFQLQVLKAGQDLIPFHVLAVAHIEILENSRGIHHELLHVIRLHLNEGNLANPADGQRQHEKQNYQRAEGNGTRSHASGLHIG